jgi:hypothetical protein
MTFLAEPRVLVYTVSRAVGGTNCARALNTLHTGVDRAGLPHDWLLWCNSADMWTASELGWMRMRQRYNTETDNVGQHIPLRWVLDYARCSDPTDHGDMIIHQPGCAPRYDFIVRVDDDIEWLTTNWLERLLHTARVIFNYSGKLAVVSADVVGLIHKIPRIGLRMKPQHGPVMKVYGAPIAGGACRLHHLSFFTGYEPDCRRAMGAADATTIAQHAEATHTPIFITPSVRVRHDTAAHIERDLAYAEEHEILQRMPYVPPWHPGQPDPMSTPEDAPTPHGGPNA